MQLIWMGLIIGIGIALPSSRALSSLLFNTSSTDVATYAAVALLLALVALVASYLPARKAMSVDPIVALRAE